MIIKKGFRNIHIFFERLFITNGHNYLLFCPNHSMSQAFVRENEEQWLHEVPPTLNALIVYLTRENNGIRVYEKQSYALPKDGKQAHLMSNGLSYALDDEGKWYVCG